MLGGVAVIMTALSLSNVGCTLEEKEKKWNLKLKKNYLPLTLKQVIFGDISAHLCHQKKLPF